MARFSEQQEYPFTLSRLLEKLKIDKYISQIDECYHLLKKGRDASAEHGVKAGPSSTALSAETDDDSTRLVTRSI